MYELLPTRSRRPVGPKVVSLCPVPSRGGVLPFADDAVLANQGAASMFTIIHRGDRASAEQFAQELLVTFALSESGYSPDISVQPLRREKHQIQICFFEGVGDDVHDILALYRLRPNLGRYQQLHPHPVTGELSRL